jgi:ankyrin repeat protein
VKALVERNADFTCYAPGDGTPLQAAASCDDADSIAVLLDAGADPMVGFAEGASALHQALYQTQISAAKVLVNRAETRIEHLYAACRKGAAMLDIIKLLWERHEEELLKVERDENVCALAWSVGSGESGSLKVTKFLLESRAGVNTISPDEGNTSLHTAIQSMEHAGASDCNEIVDNALLLIERRADLNKANDNACTPLWLAVLLGVCERDDEARTKARDLMRDLLERQVSVEDTYRGYPMLAWACRGPLAQEATVKLLLQSRATVGVSGFDCHITKESPIVLAATFGGERKRINQACERVHL